MIGYTLMTEQSGPRDLVRYAARAEEVGFDLEVMSDHYFPWLSAQGHAPYAWATLGAVTQVTESVELMTYVTCPTMRYHPAVVAQKAATTQILCGGRFVLGVGSGENLNEHVVGMGWPAVGERLDMYGEALEIINALFDGGLVDFTGDHFRVESAKLWDLPETRVPIAAAVSGERSVATVSGKCDHLVAVQPDADLVSSWTDRPHGDDSRVVGQLPVCWDRDRDAAIARAHEQFRWFAGGWGVNADLPTTRGFAGATQFVSLDDVADNIPCGDDVGAIVEAYTEFTDAGFTDVALIGIGGDHQDDFLDVCASDILPALREVAPSR